MKDHTYGILRNKEDSCSTALQLRPFMVNNFQVQVPHLPALSHFNIQKETCGCTEKARAAAKAERDKRYRKHFGIRTQDHRSVREFKTGLI